MQPKRIIKSSTEISSLDLYYAPSGLEYEVKRSLNNIKLESNSIFLAESNSHLAQTWAQFYGSNSFEYHFESINEAANFLKNQVYIDPVSHEAKIQKRWFNISHSNYRRSELIQSKLVSAKNGKIHFGDKIKKNHWGAWFLLNEHTLIGSSLTNAEVPFGELKFEEDKQNPPSRAYLKLWDFFTRFNISPKPDESVIDLGSCPGGWTWVLAELAATVYSVDTAEIDQKLISRPNVHFLKKDAFNINPKDFKSVNWMFSDIICTPDRLYNLVSNWIKNSNVKYIVATIKFKDNNINNNENILNFLSIKNSRVVHLYNNKHELTFFWNRNDN